MEVAKYTFESPSTSQVQVGRLDPSSLKEEKVLPTPVKNETQTKAENLTETQVGEVKPTITANSIDIYA